MTQLIRPPNKSIPEIAKWATALADALERHLGMSVPQILTISGSMEIHKPLQQLQVLMNPEKRAWDQPGRAMVLNPDGALQAALSDVQLVMDETILAMRARMICDLPNLQPRNIFASPTLIPTPDDGFFVHPIAIERLRVAARDLASHDGAAATAAATPAVPSAATNGDGNSREQPKKKVKTPSDEAIEMYRLHYYAGRKQTDLVTIAKAQWGRNISQGVISRSIDKVKKFVEAGNILPVLGAPKKAVSVDPARLDLGETTRKTTKRQRQRQSED